MQKSLPPPPARWCAPLAEFSKPLSKCGLAARSAHWALEPRTRSRTGPKSCRALGPERVARWARRRSRTGPESGPQRLARWPRRRSLAGLTYRSERFQGQVHECLRPSVRAPPGPARDAFRRARSGERVQASVFRRAHSGKRLCVTLHILFSIKLPPQLSIRSVSNSDFGKRKFSSRYCTVPICTRPRKITQ